MARKKAGETAQLTFKCDATLSAALRDLAFSTRSDLSAVIVTACTELVRANKQRIINYRRHAAAPMTLPTFDEKFSRTSPKKIDTPMTGGDENAEN